ncbi:MAG: hypothetical protein K5857_01665 [Lachnospiraceae bacterium]|nr:hypothetical protein [Lachnospiraceae bacterium]
MGDDYNQGGSFQYRAFGERRGFRPLADNLYKNDLIDDFPTDRRSLAMIKSDIIGFTEYAYRRISEKGYVEEEMIEELHNIAIVLKAYCEVKHGELWDSDFNTFNIRFFEYLLKTGLKYDKNLVAEALTKSGILNALSTFIIQYKNHIFDSSLVLNYYDISVEVKNRNMLCFMTYQVSPRIKDIIDIRIEDLTIQELEDGIRSGFFNDIREEVRTYLKELLLYKSIHDKKGYEDLRTRILKLHLMEYIEISGFEDMLSDHCLYRLKYHPDKIDYAHFPLGLLCGLINVNILKDVVRYGGYDFFLRISELYETNRKVRYSYITANILRNERFRRIYYEEKQASD